MPCGKKEEQVVQVVQKPKRPPDQVVQVVQKPKRPPVEYDLPQGERLMLIRFKDDLMRTMKNAFSAEKKVLENYKGTVIGMTNQVQLLETSGGDSAVKGYGFVILTFHSEKDCANWLASDKFFKQPDFPCAADSLEIASFPLNYVPKENSFHTFQISIMSDFRDADFQKKYVDPVTALMNELGVRHGLVATMDVNKMRHSNWLEHNSFVLISVFEDPSHFKMFYDSEEYRKHRLYRSTTCRTTSFFFDLAGRSLTS